MNVFLWIVQVILAVLFGMSGVAKVVKSKDELAGKYLWMQDYSQAMVWFIGMVELLGPIGLILPAATGIAPVLTPIAATGLAVLGILGAVVHIRRKEPHGVALITVLLVLAAFVAVARFGPYGW